MSGQWRKECGAAMDRALEELNLSVEREKREKLLDYGELLMEGNQSMNLTALEEPIDVAQKHLADSLLPLCYDSIPRNAYLIDVGTGAGLPGLPLAVVRPDIRLVLLDSLEKRIRFLRDCCEKLGVQAECIHGRAEDVAWEAQYRDAFDVVVSRAVAAAPLLTELTLPFVKKGGVFLAYKGAKGQEEFTEAQNAIRVLRGEWATTEEMSCSWGMRSLIVVKKKGATPRQYPRKVFRIKKAPL